MKWKALKIAVWKITGSWINTWINIVDISIEDLSLNHSGIMAGI